MEILRPGGDPAAFLSALRGAPVRVLMSDYDGTLAPFVRDRRQAAPWPGAAQALARLAAGGRTRVVVVSGRPADEVLACLGMPCPVEAWGVHGRERRLPDGRLLVEPVPPVAGAALAEAARVARERGWGELLEEKEGALALHWRGLDADRARRLAAEAPGAWVACLREDALEMHPFDGGLELRLPGVHKGEAVRAVLAEAGPGAAAAYLGDDMTDEDAFAALAGRGLPVLVREERRPTGAALWLRPPAELLEFLDRWATEADPAGRSP